MTGVNGSGLLCDLLPLEKPSTAPLTPQYLPPPPPHLAQECQETPPTVFRAPGNGGGLGSHPSSVSL